MDRVLLWFHPLMQVVAACIGVFAMWQGLKRVSQQHAKKKVIFPWKQHVRWGSVALILWTAGALGFYVTLTVFGGTHITGLHAQLAWVVIALSLFGLASGYVMNKYKKRRKILPMVHGIANVFLLILVFFECWTGYQMLGSFVY